MGTAFYLAHVPLYRSHIPTGQDEQGKSGCKVVHTDPQPAGSFSCSNELFNKINEVYLRTQKNNFHGSISSDCPHRERLAYTGDAQVVVESSILSFDMTQFYRKWFDDMGMPGIGRAVMFRIPHPSVVEEAVRHGDRLM